MEKLYTEDEVRIHTPVSKVWEVLIDPKMTPQYMFGCEVICDWNIGSPIVWKGVSDGVVYVKGDLVRFEQEKVFAFTLFDPLASYEDSPENYLTATYTLTTDGDDTVLKVTQGDYATVAEGQKRYEDTLAQGGWGGVLEGIKKIAEG